MRWGAGGGSRSFPKVSSQKVERWLKLRLRCIKKWLRLNEKKLKAALKETEKSVIERKIINLA